MKKLTKILTYSFLSIVIFIIYLPILSLLIFSFNEGRSVTNFTGFSFKWYVELFTDSQLMNSVITTLIVAAVSTIISTLIGVFAAISLTKMRKRVRELLMQSANIPIVNPEIVTAVSLFLLFGAFMIERGFLTLLLAHIAFSVPYVLITVYPKVKELDPNILDAAYDLGATPWKALFKVIFPQIKVAIFAGAAIAFTMSFDDFIISYFAVSGTSISNISIYLYSLKRGVKPTINALSSIIILVIGIKIMYDYFKQNKKKEIE
jgi:spermidine/putrescine transport system permease protein